jgi:hypothetical protein
VYKLECLDGTPIEGGFSARQLHRFTPKPGSKLEMDQREWETQHDNEEEQEDEEQKADSQNTKVGTAQTLLFMEGEHGVGIRRRRVGEPDMGVVQGSICTVHR